MPKNTDPNLLSALEEKPHFLGHRKRLRERFQETGGDGLPDYELLELVLFRAIPRRDTKPLAKALINRFGSFAETITAPENQLLEIDGVGQSVINEFKLIRAASVRLVKGEILDRPILNSWQALLDYCHAAMAYQTREQFRVIYLDKRNHILDDEIQQEGTVDHTPVYVREVVKRALDRSATAIILLHNHPSGDPTPSRADIEMTRQIVNSAKPFGITVHDHVIIGKQGHASFRQLGLL